jgi:ATP-dependent DNA helicase RecQ
MGRPSANAVARRALGFSLRAEQREAVDAVVNGRDALVVMPTGAGKSAIYQVAGTLIPGVTVVVSPLIALQRDQLAAIEESELAPAAALNSSLPDTARGQTLDMLESNALEFVFLAPEQLTKEDTFERLRDAAPSLLVVDEAHCISEWGHDFRPDYLRLGTLVAEIGRPTVLALTATASPPVREEIVARLHLDDPLVVVHGFDRPNLHFSVEAHTDDDAKRAALVEAVAAAPKPGIVYAATRARAEETTAALAVAGVDARTYHAGLPKGERADVHEAFSADELDVVVATVAFGMGIDKPNVRFVFHLDASDSIDAYMQEVGRAGRDGDAALARLFYRPEDLGLRRFFAGTGNVDADEVEQVVAVLERVETPIVPTRLQEETGLSETKLATALGRLEDAGAVEILPTGEIDVAGDLARPGLVKDAVEAQEARRAFDRSRLEMLRGYAEVRDCRRGYLLNYFGEPFEPPCGNCDTCDAGIAAEAPADVPFPIGARVHHADWGDGTVQRYEADKMTVLFDDVGYKTLAIELVVDGELLRFA